MKWTNLDNPDVYYDTESFRVPFITARYAFLRLADEFLREGNKKEAEEVLDKVLEIMPDESVPYDQLVTNFPIFYYEIGNTKKATDLADKIVAKADEELKYFAGKVQKGGDRQWGDENIRQTVQSDMRTIQLLYSAAEQYDKPAAERYKKIYENNLSRIQ
ncbi:MAG: hypothetical protein LRY55_11710 [Leadbetterella sp.]|nr:hypothetical protein [Leadbetterella sp.]